MLYTLGSTNIGVAGTWTSEKKNPVEHGDIPASYVSLPP